MTFYDRLSTYLQTQRDIIALSLLKELITTPLRRRVRLVDAFNLRTSPNDKYALCPEGSNDWIVFLNKKGTLAHVFRYGAPDLMIRLPNLKLHGASEAYKIKRLQEIIDVGL